MRGYRSDHSRGRWPLLALLAALAGVLLNVGAGAANGSQHEYYLPILGRQQALCHPSAQEQALASLLAGDAQQQRPVLRCNALLEQVARAHAADMAARDYVGYVTPEGKGMNDLVRQAGYALPDTYSAAPGANQVAAIAVGHESAASAWAGLIDPDQGDDLRNHLLGLTPFFARQIDYGIGYVADPDSTHDYYWVIVTAEPVRWPAGLERPESVLGPGLAPQIERVVIYTP